MRTAAITRLFRPNRRLGLLQKLSLMLGLRRQRLHLSMLDDRLLRDIGLTRREAEEEASRTIWDAPQHWHR